MGSLLFLVSWGVLMGPIQYSKHASRSQRSYRFFDCAYADFWPPPVQHLVSGPRLPFTAAYFGSIALTLFFSIKVGHRLLYTPMFPARSKPCASRANPVALRSSPPHAGLIDCPPFVLTDAPSA